MRINGMTSAASALRYWERRQEIMANNLANVETSGFKGERVFAWMLGDARPATLNRIGELRVQPDRTPRLVIDSRDGTIVGGGDLVVGEATVSHGAITLSIGAGAGGGADPGNVQLPPGTPVQQVAAALYAVRTPPGEIAAIFEALREVGAISAEVVIR